MKLHEASYQWSIRHLLKESDTDLFPMPPELAIIQSNETDLIAELLKIDIGAYKWNSARRFLVPKDDLAYRVATQLHPIDSIVLGAIVYEFGRFIESKRVNEDTVYSYRFRPLTDGTMYANKKAWNRFWKSCQDKIVINSRIVRVEDDDNDQTQSYVFSDEYTHIVTCDISDFYNQIYLHTIENQLVACGCPNQVKVAIKSLLLSLNEASSRGVPIGPHSSHLMAELSLIPVDNSLKLQGVVYKRYVDDFIFFCKDEKEARIRVQQLAEILDKEQRLVLQRQKTKIYSIESFFKHTQRMLIEEPIYDTEKQIIDIISEYTDGNAYTRIKLDEISDEDLAILSQEKIVELLEEYVSQKNFEKLRWIYRRLSQIGIPHAIDYSIDNFEQILPALNDVCLYLNSCAENYKSDWKDVGDYIVDVLEDKIIQSNTFYQISLLNLFVYNSNLNHAFKLISLFKKSNEDVRRKILLACIHYEAAAWLYELKEEQSRFSEWTRRAYLIATKSLPPEQKKFLHNSIRQSLSSDSILERLILNWAK
ncbi:MAG: RNA-directed DNA polymerase [Bacteroidetes bacterium]|nr:RNA-directed DNA polymerase [Bacteroidota bacterium]